MQLMRAHRGKDLLLGAYGLKMHMPAVEAELCIHQEVGSTLHDMLLTIRMVKQGGQRGMLRVSAAPLPRMEPWLAKVLHGPTPILNIMNSRISRHFDSIEHFGERGNGRDMRTVLLRLHCPFCGSSRECAKVRLYATSARALGCNNCNRSTTSTRWSCAHGTPWTSCTQHREEGFRCGSRSRPICKADPSKRNRVRCPLKALKQLQAKKKRLGQPFGA